MPLDMLETEVVDEVADLDTMDLNPTGLDAELGSVNTIMQPFAWYFDEATVPPPVTRPDVTC
jgi:hypothetical protein